MYIFDSVYSSYIGSLLILSFRFRSFMLGRLDLSSDSGCYIYVWHMTGTHVMPINNSGSKDVSFIGVVTFWAFTQVKAMQSVIFFRI